MKIISASLLAIVTLNSMDFMSNSEPSKPGADLEHLFNIAGFSIYFNMHNYCGNHKLFRFVSNIKGGKMKYNLKLILMTFLPILSVLLMAASPLADTFHEVNMEKFLTEKRKVVKDVMQLSDSESAVFWPLYDEFEKIIVESINKDSVLIKEYMQEHENLSDKKAKAMINELLELQAEYVQDKRVFSKKFSEKLAPQKVLQYFVLEEIIEAGYWSMIVQELPLIKQMQ